MVKINPEFNAGNQEGLNLILAQIKVESSPSIVMSSVVILILESRCPIIVGQSIIINSEMTWYPVHNDPDIVQVTFFNEVLKLLRRPVGVLEGEVAHELIAPAKS